MKTLEQALAETPEQFSQRMSERAARQEADHATRKAQAINGIDANEFEFSKDCDEIEFTGEVCGMTISGYASYKATYEAPEPDLVGGWDIEDLEIKEITINFGVGLNLRTIPHDSPFAAGLLEEMEAWLDGQLENETP
jgi:hypothetical protein